MAYIEGFGDEVVYLLAAMAVLLALTLIWISTSVNDRAHRHVVVMDRARFQQFMVRLGIARARGGNRPMRHWRTMLRRVDSLPAAGREPSGHDPAEPAAIVSTPSAGEARTADVRANDQSHTEGAVDNDQFHRDDVFGNGAGNAQSLSAGIVEPLPSARSEISQMHQDSGTSEVNHSERTNGIQTETNAMTRNGVTVCSSVESEDIDSDGTDNSDLEAKEGDLTAMRKLRVAFLEGRKLSSQNDVIDPQHSDAIQIDNVQATSSDNSVQDETRGNDGDMVRGDRTDSGQVASEDGEAGGSSGASTDSEGAGAGSAATDDTQRAGEGGEPLESEGGEPLESEGGEPLEGEGGEPLEGHIRVRIRFLDERQTTVQARPEDTLHAFKRTHLAAEVAENLRVRLIHNGRELRDDAASLRAHRVTDNSVLHCLLSRAHLQPAPTHLHGAQQEVPAPDIGFLVFPLFGFMLALIWYCRIEYRQYFNAISTLSLMGITFLYAIALMASRQRRHAHAHQD